MLGAPIECCTGCGIGNSNDGNATVPGGMRVARAHEINENDEWTAIQKFNTLLHFEEQKQAFAREEERKRTCK